MEENENNENRDRLIELFNSVEKFLKDGLDGVNMKEDELLGEAVAKQSRLLSEILTYLPIEQNKLITEYQKATSVINASRESRIYFTGLLDGLDMNTCQSDHRKNTFWQGLLQFGRGRRCKNGSNP